MSTFALTNERIVSNTKSNAVMCFTCDVCSFSQSSLKQHSGSSAFHHNNFSKSHSFRFIKTPKSNIILDKQKTTHEDMSQNSHNSWLFHVFWKMMFPPSSWHQSTPSKAHTQLQHTDTTLVAHSMTQGFQDFKGRSREKLLRWVAFAGTTGEGERGREVGDRWLH